MQSVDGRCIPAIAISVSNGGHSLPSLGICEQAPPVVLVTSGVAAEEGNSTKHHPLPSLPWKCTCPDVAAARGTAYTFLRVTTTAKGRAARSRLYHMPPSPYHCQGPINQALATGPAHCFPLPGSICRLHTGTTTIKGIRACTHGGKR